MASLVYESAPGKRSRAWVELIETLRNWPFWLKLAELDIRLRYRRTVLGPFWVTITGGISLFAMGFVFSALFGQDISTFLPYVGAGLTTWMTISLLITEGSQCLENSVDLLLERRQPFWIPAFQMTVRNIIVLAHYLCIFALIALIFGVKWNLSLLLLVPAIVIYGLNGIWIGIVLGFACARFRDLPNLIKLLLQISFFVTPVFWKREMLTGPRSIITDINPLYYFIELGRGPLLGYVPDASVFIVTGAITVVGWLTAFFVYNRYRRVVPFWL